MRDTLFATDTAVGRITVEPLDLDRDAELLHGWVTHPGSRFWMMQDATLDDVRTAYGAIAADPHHDAWLGRVDGGPAFLAETYDPARATEPGLTDVPELEPGDFGMHVLVAPTDEPRSGFTGAVFGAVMEFCFADSTVRRVVVEPDAGNARIRRKNLAAGFRELRPIDLPGKTGMLSVCTRADFAGSVLTAGPVARHLAPVPMELAQRHLVAKAIGELAHERLIEPEQVVDEYVLTAGESTYSFTATRHDLEHWVVDPASLDRVVDGRPASIDAQQLILELAPLLGLPDDLMGVYLEEIASTLAGQAWKRTHAKHSAAELLDADLPTIEAAMTEGHPAFIANNGRIGFSMSDHAAYAPEAGSDVHLEWLAVRRSLSHLALGRGGDERALYAAELGDQLESFRDHLSGLGLDPDDYLFMPVHPWQWQHRIAVTFAPDVARRDLVHVGTSVDRYRAQQSIRTFLNADRPERAYVKTALAVQNMGFVRGLSPRYMVAAPAINDWVADLVAGDPELAGFEVLREHASIGYTGDAYHRSAITSPYQKMLAALWREPAAPRAREGERLATMASLLHRDMHGDALATAMIRASGVEPTAWLRSFADAYLRPITHCLVAHQLAFMPHGENLILVIRDHVPVRVLMKDIGEEVVVMDDQPLPAEIERIRADVPDDMKVLSILTDAMDGFLRFLAGIVVDDGLVTIEEFWSTMAASLDAHRSDHPDLPTDIDVFVPDLAHSCLNRLQLRNTRQMVDLTDQASSLMFAGTLVNPLARHRR